jgi:hypothetical protein
MLKHCLISFFYSSEIYIKQKIWNFHTAEVEMKFSVENSNNMKEMCFFADYQIFFKIAQKT